MNKTGIEWCDRSWNPVTGCTPVSDGCQNCYAQRVANRLRGRCGYLADDPFRVTLHPDRLEEPLKVKKPQRIFVCSMGDLFHDDVPTRFIDDVLEVIAACPQHTFMVLTKRPWNIYPKLYEVTEDNPVRELGGGDFLPNFWLGTSVENQQRLDERLPWLLGLDGRPWFPAALRFVSVEPMLGPVDARRYLPHHPAECLAKGMFGRDCPRCQREGKTDQDCLGWVICGAETGPGKRYMASYWALKLLTQCREEKRAFHSSSKRIVGQDRLLSVLAPVASSRR